MQITLSKTSLSSKRKRDAVEILSDNWEAPLIRDS
jgi:hypothetical protein